MTSPMEEYTGDLEMESSLFTSLTLAYKPYIITTIFVKYPMEEYTGDLEMESSLFTALTLAYKPKQ